MSLVITRREYEGCHLFLDGQPLGRVSVRYGRYAGEIKIDFDCDRRLTILRDELVRHDAVAPPHPPSPDLPEEWHRDDDPADFDADRRNSGAAA